MSKTTEDVSAEAIGTYLTSIGALKEHLLMLSTIAETNSNKDSLKELKEQTLKSIVSCEEHAIYHMSVIKLPLKAISSIMSKSQEEIDSVISKVKREIK